MDAGADSGIDTDGDTDTAELIEITDAAHVYNPYGNVDLVAIGKVSHPDLDPIRVTEIKVTVAGPGPGAEDLVARLDPRTAQYKTNFDMSDQIGPSEVGIPILGLYQECQNRVDFEITADRARFFGTLYIQTPKADNPAEVTVDIGNAPALAPGWVWVRGRVYDNQGALRWKGVDLYRKLSNGNLLYTVDELNWLGKTVVDRTVPKGFYLHHDAVELPGGNIAALVDNEETTFINWNGEEEVSRKDYILELDRATSEIRNAWDLREYLDVSRNTLASVPGDWLHENSLEYDPRDDAIIVSSRYQGIVKITRNGQQGPTANKGKQLVWILSPHMGWGVGGWDGNGSIDPNDFLLTAVDAAGTPYPQDVQDNLAAPAASQDDFHWPVGQHGVRITSQSGDRMTLLSFNNQASFVFDGPGSVNNGVSPFTQGDLTNDRMNPPYSMLIEYEIDEKNMTVRQKWGYGQGDPAYYGSLSCSANLLSNGNRMMISSGYDSHDTINNPANPHVVEFTEQGEVVLHLEVSGADWVAYNGGKVDLYHPEL